MVLPTSNIATSTGNSQQQQQEYIREYLLNSLFEQPVTTNSSSNTSDTTNNHDPTNIIRSTTTNTNNHSNAYTEAAAGQCEEEQNYFLSNNNNNYQVSVAPTIQMLDNTKNIVLPDINRNFQFEKKVQATMTVLPQTNQSLNNPHNHHKQHVDSLFHHGNHHHESSEEEDTKSRVSTSSGASGLSNTSTFSNQSFNRSNIKKEKERSWKVSFESEEYKGLLRNTSFKIKTRTDDIEVNISSQLYSSLKYQFNISTFINKKRATELAINQKSYGGIIIATIESLVVMNRNEDDDEESLEVLACQDVLKGELELSLQPIESIEATESKAFKPFLQQLRREINKEDNDCDEGEWVCLLNKTKMQFSDQSLHNKKNSYVMRVSFYLNKEFKERKPIIIFESAPFKIYARRSKRIEEFEEPKKRKRKIKATSCKKKQKNHDDNSKTDDSSLLSKFESGLLQLVHYINEMSNPIEKGIALQSFIRNLVVLDYQTAPNISKQPPQQKPHDEPIHMHIDTSFGRPMTIAKLLNENSQADMTIPYCFNDSSSYQYGDDLGDSSKDMLLSIGQSSVLDSPTTTTTTTTTTAHTPEFLKGNESTKPSSIQTYNQPPRILQLLNQPNRIDLSKVRNIGSMNPSMLNKYLQDDVLTPTVMNSQPPPNLIAMDNSLDIFDVSPLPIQGSSSQQTNNEPTTTTFDQLIFDLQHGGLQKKKN